MIIQTEKKAFDFKFIHELAMSKSHSNQEKDHHFPQSNHLVSILNLYNTSWHVWQALNYDVSGVYVLTVRKIINGIFIIAAINDSFNKSTQNKNTCRLKRKISL